MEGLSLITDPTELAQSELTHVTMVACTPSPEEVIKLAASQCYQTAGSLKALQGCIKSGHLSILEHAQASFICTMPLKVMMQMTRHRHLSFTIQSSRGSNMTEVYPTGDEVVDEVNAESLGIYQQLLAGGMAHEDAAYILPTAIVYSVFVSGNLRAWLEYLQKRCCKRTQLTHRLMAGRIAEYLHSQAPHIFTDATIKRCSMCTERNCTFTKGMTK